MQLIKYGYFWNTDIYNFKNQMKANNVILMSLLIFRSREPCCIPCCLFFYRWPNENGWRYWKGKKKII